MMKWNKLLTVVILSQSIPATVCMAQAGYSRLFDGKTLNGWGEVSANAAFKADAGAIIGTTGNQSPSSLISNKAYTDFVLELDTKTNGSYGGIVVHARSNPAGNDSRGAITGNEIKVDPSERDWTGGITDNSRFGWIYPLSLNPKAQSAFKRGEWNHIKIESIGHTTKTWVNGVATAYLIDTVKHSGPIALSIDGTSDAQASGKKIWFKNIRIKTSGLTTTPFPPGIFVVNYTSNQLSTYEKSGGWKLLFDGKTPAGWVSAITRVFPTKPNGWIVRDGTMTILGSAGGEAANVGDIITTAEYSSFDLSFEFKMSTGANSGVKYFVTLNEDTKGSAIGLEYQVLDDQVHPDAKLGRNGDRTLASLYDLIPANKPAAFIRPIGTWNTGRIVVYPNNHVEHYLNGVKVLEYERGSKAFRDLVAVSKYVIWKNFGEAKQGHLLLQDHGFEVNYRSIKIRELNQ
jgi:hypothetical protein